MNKLYAAILILALVLANVSSCAVVSSGSPTSGATTGSAYESDQFAIHLDHLA